MAKRIEAVKAYTWQLEEGQLCYWASPNRKQLMDDEPPSPEAIAVPVRIIREADYRRLLKAAKSAPPTGVNR